MASYVELRKEAENDLEVIYRYGDGDNMTGRIRLDKKKEMIEEVEPMDISNAGFYLQRAGQKLASCYRENKGFPEKLIFAS